MNVEIDMTARALYLRLASGEVAETVVLDDGAVADYDESGALLGIEVLHPEELANVFVNDLTATQIPSRISYLVLGTDKSWDVETGAAAFLPDVDPHKVTAGLHAEFVSELLANPQLLDRIPAGATLLPVRPGDKGLSPNALLERAEQLARAGETVVLQPLGIPALEHRPREASRPPDVVVQALSPRRPSEVEDKLSESAYYFDTDTLVWGFRPTSFDENEGQRFVAIRHPAYGIMAVDLDTREVVAHLVPRFRFVFAERFPEVRSWIAQSEVRSTTPTHLRRLLGEMTPAARDPVVEHEAMTERMAGFG